MAILGLEIKNDIVEIEIGDIKIQVKQYLPIEEKLKMIAEVLANSADENNFSNPLKVDVFTDIAILVYYTDIELTEEILENPAEFYDILETNDVINKVIAAIPKVEYETVINAVADTVDAYYKYKQSAYAIMDSATKDYNQLDFDTEKIKEQLDNPENLALLKEITEKLG